MNRLDQRITSVLKRREKVFCGLLPMGDPDLATSRKLIDLYVEAGVDVIELVLPSRDPYLDSQTLADAATRALSIEDDYSKYFSFMHDIRSAYPDEPFEVMTYSDVTDHVGIEPFVENLERADMDAHLLADATEIAPAILSEMDPLLAAADIHRIRFMPHPFRESLLPDIATGGRGFMVLQAIADEGGSRPSVFDANRKLIERIRKTETRAAILLGYGICEPDRVKEAVSLDPDGIIVGSSIFEKVHQGDYDELKSFLAAMKQATLP